MTEYESARKHFSTRDRQVFLVLLVFWTTPTAGSYLAFGGYEVWLTRILVWITSGFCLLVVTSFIDARLATAENRRLREAKLVQLGADNWYWASDRDPKDTRVV